MGEIGYKSIYDGLCAHADRIATPDHLEQRMGDDFTTAFALKENSQSGFMGKLEQISLICKGLPTRVHAFTEPSST